jgi:hypothetical protein
MDYRCITGSGGDTQSWHIDRGILLVFQKVGMGFIVVGREVLAAVIKGFSESAQVKYMGKGVIFALCFFDDWSKWYPYMMLPIYAPIWCSCLGIACFRAPTFVITCMVVTPIAPEPPFQIFLFQWVQVHF